MHVVLGLLGTLVTVLWLLHRMGVNIDAVNPFAWQRRRAWAKKYHADPLFAVESPRDAAVVLAVAVAKADGELTLDEKSALRSAFQREFDVDEDHASKLLTMAAFALRDTDALVDDLDKFFRPNLERFSQEQAEATLALLTTIAELGGHVAAPQRVLLAAIQEKLEQRIGPPEKWD